MMGPKPIKRDTPLSATPDSGLRAQYGRMKKVQEIMKSMPKEDRTYELNQMMNKKKR
jgi:hypothetical protein